ncbi:hypothetical protein [Bombiscardovia coagulans]|uniref:Acetyltransferase n=1 Tax=Bombiscardovia coagulans TaxID=686666 RepID=A0A261ETH3_9BIFI|nr:hypothetical protein [Bombiscardovia coagulans]OZG50159.1 Acetyltransferase [Bombiscardovia coagulans]
MQYSNPGQRWLRHATVEDIPAIEKVFAHARQVMAEGGNPRQWGTKYPYPEMIAADVRNGNTYLLVDNAGETPDATNGTFEAPELEEVRGDHERIIGLFSLFDGEDPAYGDINGAWLDNDPYMTIHRVASSGLGKRAASDIISWCMRHYHNVRIDTGPNNFAMQHILETHHFIRCGTIGVLDNQNPDMDESRLAYHRHDH